MTVLLTAFAGAYSAYKHSKKIQVPTLATNQFPNSKQTYLQMSNVLHSVGLNTTNRCYYSLHCRSSTLAQVC